MEPCAQAPPPLDWELVRPSMLRMLRSAKSRLHRDALGPGGAPAAPSTAADTDALGPCVAETLDAPLLPNAGYVARADSGLSAATEAAAEPRSLKRTGAARFLLGTTGVNRQRSARSRYVAADPNTVYRSAPADSENVMGQNKAVGQALAFAQPLGGTVLGDVTNTAGQPCFAAGGPKVPATLAAPAAPRAAKSPMPFALPLAAEGAAVVAPRGDATALLAAFTTSPSVVAAARCGDVESDLLHAEDPQHCMEYVPDIYRHMQRDEAESQPSPSYMDRQLHVNAKMRAILVDWLVDVHRKYKLRNETLFLAVGYVDRFLERRVTARRHLQLVGVTALLIAAKFEEQYPPQVKEFVYVTDKAYTEDEVMKMEVMMLNVLDFKVSRPTAWNFFQRYQTVNGCTDAHQDLAQYLLELTLVEYKMVRHTPSHLAAAAVLLSNKLLRRTPCWTTVAVKHTCSTEQMLKDTVKEMGVLLEGALNNPLQAVRKKFSQQKHHAVAKLDLQCLAEAFSMVGEASSLPSARRCSTASASTSAGTRSGGNTPASRPCEPLLQSRRGQCFPPPPERPPGDAAFDIAKLV